MAEQNQTGVVKQRYKKIAEQLDTYLYIILYTFMHILYFSIWCAQYIYWCLSGHIVSDVSGIIRCFSSFNIMHPPPGDPAGAEQAPACVRMA